MKKGILVLLACVGLLAALAAPVFADSSPLGGLTGSTANVPAVGGLFGAGTSASKANPATVSSTGLSTTEGATVAPGAQSNSTKPGGGSGADNAKADIQQGNFFCGLNVPTLPVIGFTDYHRNSPTTVSINYHLKGAVPNAQYQVQLWGDACSFFGTIGTVTTNSNGVANASGSVTVPATSTRFFATAFGPNIFNDTPAVILTP